MSLRRPRDDFDFEIGWANRAYDRIRASDNDIASVAETAGRYGFSTEDVITVKNHVFRDEHLLDLYGDDLVGPFDANPRMAEAWQRLTDGNPHPADIDLLNHERYEANLMATTGDPSYLRAHTATNEAGFTVHGRRRIPDHRPRRRSRKGGTAGSEDQGSLIWPTVNEICLVPGLMETSKPGRRFSYAGTEEVSR